MRNGATHAFTLGEAARTAGVSKATIHRQIKAGKLSATRHDDGSYSIDPAELHRVHPFQVNGSEQTPVRQHGTPDETPRNPAGDVLQAELSGARALIAALEQQLADTRTDRDAWREQAQQSQRLLEHKEAKAEPRRGFLSRLFN